MKGVEEIFAGISKIVERIRVTLIAPVGRPSTSTTDGNAVRGRNRFWAIDESLGSWPIPL